MENYLNRKQTSLRSMPTIKLDFKAVMHITESFNLKIAYMCKMIENIEWSGVLFFEAKGDINSQEGIIITPIDIYPMDKGSSAYTEYDFTEEVFDYYEKHPDRFGMKYGHIHSHHNMSTFFSGTDTQELIDNCVNHSYYVSLIVNNKNEMTARVAIAGERKMKASSVFSLKGLKDSMITIPRDEDVTENVMYYADIEIVKEESLFMNKAKDIAEPKKQFIATGTGSMQQRIDWGNYNNKAASDVLPQREKTEYNALEIFNECVGGPNTDSLTETFDYMTVNIDEYESEKAAIADLTDYVEACFNYDAISEEMRNYQRNYFEHPDIEDVIDIMKKIKSLISPFLNGSADHKLVANIITITLDSEIKKLSLYEEQSL